MIDEIKKSDQIDKTPSKADRSEQKTYILLQISCKSTIQRYFSNQREGRQNT